MHIDRIPASIDFAEFHTKYFIPEVPVILTGVRESAVARAQWTSEKLLEKLERDGTQKDPLCYRSTVSYAESICKTPSLIQNILADPDCLIRDMCCRLWVRPQNHTTGFHHDGNLLFVFMLQISGSKRWTIVSPDTPLPNYPFSHIVLASYNRANIPAAHTISEFELHEDEILFLPALWQHEVTSLGKENISINWTGTKRPVESALLRRERELLKCATSFPKLVQRVSYMNDAYLTHYADSSALIKEMTASVPLYRALARLTLEYRMLPAYLKDKAELREHY